MNEHDSPEVVPVWDLKNSTLGYDGVPVTPDQLQILTALAWWFPDPLSARNIATLIHGDRQFRRATLCQLRDLQRRGFVLGSDSPSLSSDWTLGPLADDLLERGIL